MGNAVDDGIGVFFFRALASSNPISSPTVLGITSDFTDLDIITI